MVATSNHAAYHQTTKTISQLTRTVMNKYTPDELKTLFDALNSAPSWISKRFVLKSMLGWSDEDLKQNITMIEEENRMRSMGNKGAY
jgi:hypothetical protein